MRKRGRPKKTQTQPQEERNAYLREYARRPEVIARRRVVRQAYYRRTRAQETPEERDERLAYQRLRSREYLARIRAQETPEEREARLAKNREACRRHRERKRRGGVST